ncbi:MAG: ABC transporter permease [Gammaproteobacteria bacterium]|nr:ABC transporter permease [Gammaproteobacteria bacterium]MDE0453495.1 ABC transporter permease [Gammaproteobacteria bacterium]
MRIALLTATNLAAAVRRPAATLTIVLAAAVVVGVTTSMAALARGLYLQFLVAGSEDRALVLEGDARRIGQSILTSEQVEFVYQAAGASEAINVDRIAIAGAHLAARDAGAPELVEIRGVTPEGLRMRPNIRMLTGRMFESGRHQAVAGAHATELFRDARVGDRITFALGELAIVGTFESGDRLDSVFLVDAGTIFGRRCHAMVVDLGSPDSFDDFRAALEAHPTFDYGVHRESDHLDALAWTRSEVFLEIGVLLGAIMTIGGVFCSTNVTLSAVAGRRSEIATLRAVGFPTSDIAASTLLETLLLVAIGAAMGVAGSWALLDGVLVREGGSRSISFRPEYDARAILHGVFWSAAFMVSGALFAIWRALRRPVPEDLAAFGR